MLLQPFKKRVYRLCIFAERFKSGCKPLGLHKLQYDGRFLLAQIAEGSEIRWR